MREELLAGSERYREHEQVQLVEEAAGKHPAPERAARAHVDRAVGALLQLAQPLRAVGPENRRVVPGRVLERSRYDELRRLVEERRPRIVLGGSIRPGGIEHLVGPATEEDRLALARDGGQRFGHLRVEAVVEGPRRVLIDAVEADEFVYRDRSHAV